MNLAASIALSIVSGVGGSILLLLPGWVLLTVYARGVKGPDLPERVFLLQTAFAGVFVHLVASPWTVWLGMQITSEGVERNVVGILTWILAVFILLPVIVGTAFSFASDYADQIRPRWLRQLLARVGISTSVRTSTAWTMAWRTLRKEVFVRVRKTDGSHVLGRFGEASLAAADPSRRDLFIEELWGADHDGWFLEPYPHTAGVWLNGEDIESVEFFEGID
jgi:hypothetical protein